MFHEIVRKKYFTKYPRLIAIFGLDFLRKNVAILNIKVDSPHINLQIVLINLTVRFTCEHNIQTLLSYWLYLYWT